MNNNRYLRIPGQRRIRRLNARQRKKNHVGEFQELGFELTVAFVKPLDEAECDVLWDEVFDQVEQLQLLVGGFGGRLPLSETSAFVCADGSQSVTPAQRDALLAFLNQHPLIAKAEAGEMVDAWYGWA